MMLQLDEYRHNPLYRHGLFMEYDITDYILWCIAIISVIL